MAKKEYDKILRRLITILNKLTNNEQPTVKELAEEFGVSKRTIQKDLNDRLQYFSIIKDPITHRYSFDNGFTLKDTELSNEEMVFLDIALNQFEDVEDFNTIKEKIYKKLIRKKLITPYCIKHDDLEDLDIDSLVVMQLENAIKDNKEIEITFEKTQKHIQPYKLVAVEGLWYLFGFDKATKKNDLFRLPKITKVKILDRYFTISADAVEEMLEHVHSAFFEDGKNFDIVIKVAPQIAENFENIEYIESQKIISKEKDGSLIVSYQVSHFEDVDNVIKSWIPHVEVLEPKEYKTQLIKELREYIENS